MKNMFKKIASIMLLSTVLAVSAFAQKVDYSTISFIEDIYNKKIPCTKDNFFTTGFVKDKTGSFISTWEGLSVETVLDNGSLQCFKFTCKDKQTFLEGWKKLLSYAKEKNCKITTDENTQYYINGKIVIGESTSYYFNGVCLCNHTPYEDVIVISKDY